LRSWLRQDCGCSEWRLVRPQMIRLNARSLLWSKQWFWKSSTAAN